MRRCTTRTSPRSRRISRSRSATSATTRRARSIGRRWPNGSARSIYRGGLADAGGAHLHPLNYALGLARAAEAAGAKLFEASRATRVDPAGHGVETAAGRIAARQVLLCCNGYLDGLMAPLAARILPISNYIIATEPLGEAAARALIRDDVAVCDSKFVVNYYRRSADHRLLFGGGEVYTRRDPRDIKEFVRRHMLAVYPQLAGARIDFGWGGRLAITMNRLPHLGRLAPDLYFAHGYSGQGVALAGLAGTADGGGDRRHGGTLRRLRPHPASEIPGRPAAAPSGADPRHAVLQPARPVLGGGVPAEATRAAAQKPGSSS